LQKLCGPPSKNDRFIEGLLAGSIGSFINIYILSSWVISYFDIDKSIYLKTIGFISLICGIWYAIHNVRNSDY